MGPRRHYDWTMRREKILKDMAKDGCFPGEIASALGTSSDIVSRKAHGLGVVLQGSRRKPAPTVKERAA
jgi:hypothetical protein